jgi:hypothetical protein
VIYLLALLAGIVGAVVGWFLTAVVALTIAGFYDMTDFEGARGMFAFLFAGPLGGLASMIASVWIVLRVGKGRAPLARTLVQVGSVLGAIALLVTGGILLRLYTLDTYTDTLPPLLEFEVRLPAEVTVEDRANVRVELHTDKNVADSQAHTWSAAENGAEVLAGLVSLDFKTTSRLLVVSMPGQPTRLFALRLARDPDASASLSPWAKPDHLDAAGDEAPRPASPDDPVEIRYRVRRPGD